MPARPESGARVVVLGAGLAGLAAAWELAEAGREVVVLEARDRPGGRIETLRDGFTHGLYADAGAMAFTDDYRTLFDFARHLGLASEPLAERWAEHARATAHYHLRGRHLVADAGGGVEWPHELSEEERRLGRWGIVERYLIGAVEDAPLPPDPAELPAWARAVDGLTLAELMRARGASEGAIELVRHGVWFGEAIHRVSAAACLVADVGMFFREQREHTFAGGLDRLPRALADRLGARIVYGAEVVGLRALETSVEVAVRRAGALERLAAGAAVCTLPFSVLSAVEIEPALADARSGCVRGLRYAPVTRVFVQVRRRFWRASGRMAPAYTDLAVGRVLEQPLVPPPSAGDRTLLEAHAGGDAALRLDRLSADERATLVRDELERVHPGVGAEVEAIVAKSWAGDPWARGAYSLYGPGELGRWLRLVQSPEGRIHFAGEHTSRLTGTLEGALESGVRAAREILAAS